jgi:hypothetical protein
MQDPVANQLFKSNDSENNAVGITSSVMPHMTEGINPNDYILSPSETVTRVGQAVSNVAAKARK